MAIVFGFDDDNVEPIDWLERMDLVEDTLWAAREPSYAVVFFDCSVFDAVDPAVAIEAMLSRSAGGRALRLEQWGYLQPHDNGTRQAIAKLEHERSASPLLRYHYGTGLLLAAVVRAPDGSDLTAESFGRHPALVDVVSFPDQERIWQSVLPA